jgi:O-acetyl-ADP-ribose deacetylase (regulator of RNase III)
MTSPDLNFDDPDSAFYLILGGEDIEEHCRAVHNLQVGSCIHTKAGSLPAEYIIHSAQPAFHAYKDQVYNLLSQAAIINILEAARNINVEKVAIPIAVSDSFEQIED